MAPWYGRRRPGVRSVVRARPERRVLYAADERSCVLSDRCVESAASVGPARGSYADGDGSVPAGGNTVRRDRRAPRGQPAGDRVQSGPSRPRAGFPGRRCRGDRTGRAGRDNSCDHSSVHDGGTEVVGIPRHPRADERHHRTGHNGDDRQLAPGDIRAHHGPAPPTGDDPSTDDSSSGHRCDDHPAATHLPTAHMDGRSGWLSGAVAQPTESAAVQETAPSPTLIWTPSPRYSGSGSVNVGSPSMRTRSRAGSAPWLTNCCR